MWKIVKKMLSEANPRGKTIWTWVQDNIEVVDLTGEIIDLSIDMSVIDLTDTSSISVLEDSNYSGNSSEWGVFPDDSFLSALESSQFSQWELGGNSDVTLSQ